MMLRRWDVPAFDDDEQTSPTHPVPTLVSLHFIRAALRRRWLVCVLSAVCGLLMAMTYLVAFPQPHHAKAALVLAHQEGVDPTLAMATDIGLLMSRTVAEETIASVGLTLTPDDFLKSVAPVRVSTDLLSVTLSAPSDAEAVRRLEALTSIYLSFRAEQLSSQSNVYVDGVQEQIDKLQGEVDTLTRQIGELSASGSSSKLSELISSRAYLDGKIETLQQSKDDVALRSTSVVSSSKVIDPPAVEVGRAKRRAVLTMASGFIGGAALGCGAVLFIAVTSDRLRRRSDVAAAVERSVPISVGRIAPLPKRWLWLPHLRTLDGRRAHDRLRLAHAIEMELPLPRRWGRLAVACIDNADDVRFAVATAATNLAANRCSVTLIDLTEHANLDVDDSPPISGSTDRPTVLRPDGIPALASADADLRAVGHEDWDGSPIWPQLTDVTLVLTDLDSGVGAEHLTAWADRVIITVTAGRSRVERIRTAAELVRSAGLDLRFAALLRTERWDDSSGVVDVNRAAAIQPPDEYDQSVSTEKPEDRPAPGQPSKGHDQSLSTEKPEDRPAPRQPSKGHDQPVSTRNLRTDLHPVNPPRDMTSQCQRRNLRTDLHPVNPPRDMTSQCQRRNLRTDLHPVNPPRDMTSQCQRQKPEDRPAPRQPSKGHDQPVSTKKPEDRSAPRQPSKGHDQPVGAQKSEAQ